MHTCHAKGCEKPVPPKMLMCPVHWFSLRKVLRDAVWREYRPGQEIDKNPSVRYLAVHTRAIAEELYQRLAKTDEPRAREEAEPFIQAAEDWRNSAISRRLGDPLEGLSLRLAMVPTPDALGPADFGLCLSCHGRGWHLKDDEPGAPRLKCDACVGTGKGKGA